MIQLTQEEIDELQKLTEEYRLHQKAYASYSNWNRDWKNEYSYDYWDSPPPFKRTRHEWVPVLLLNQTVYDCKHCGAKKEKTKGDYCEDETEF